MNELNSPFVIHSGIQYALQNDLPVIALETAVLTHGLPKPDNFELVTSLESVARSMKVAPATIGILHGRIHIGLDMEQLAILANSDGMRKITRRDFSIAVASQSSGGTTVAGTLFAAHRAGIRVFATGGIGGIHRNSTFDMSADLPELARTPMIVVCAGAKAILDLPATCECLETMGVPVIGYKTDEFPAFYSAQSGLPVDHRADSTEEIVSIYRSHLGLGMDSAILVVVPPPLESSVPVDVIESAIDTAVKEAESGQIHGAALTPYLLCRVSELTNGESLRSNLALLRNNVRIGCEIALAL
jgi:pseudouridylate synthase